ncbi:hypothetical protein ACWGDX_13535 [Streptomyces sp. NPDC055025]
MNSFTATYFLDKKSDFRGNSSVHPVFYVEPNGEHRNGYITLQIDANLSADEQLKIADRLADAAGAWRDGLAARADSERTAADELAEAHAEIARLKAEAGEDA